MADDFRVSGNSNTSYNGISVNTPFEDNSKGVQVDDFLQLMIAQLTNQDFLNPTDDTQYVTQLAQFASMQAMQELADYSKTNYVMGLIGKSVTTASYTLGGGINTETGIVTKVDMSGDEFTFTVNGKNYTLSQLMTINDADGSATSTDLNAANNMKVIVTKSSDSTVSLRWDDPIEDTTGLTYSVYYTTDGSVDFNNLSNVKKGELAAENIKDNEFEITDLEPGTPYYINVVVKNAKGEEAVYMRTITITEK